MSCTDSTIPWANRIRLSNIRIVVLAAQKYQYINQIYLPPSVTPVSAAWPDHYLHSARRIYAEADSMPLAHSPLPLTIWDRSLSLRIQCS